MCFHILHFFMLLFTGCDFDPSHAGRAEGDIVHVKEEPKEPEEVKGTAFSEPLMLTSCWSASCISSINCSSFHFYVCPQLLKDVDHRLSGSCGFRSADVKEERSVDHSNYIKSEGNPAIRLHLVLHCIDTFSIIMSFFVFPVPGCGVSERVSENENVVYLKDEFFEVSDSF